MNNKQIRDDIGKVVEYLEGQGIKHNDSYDQIGVGDVVEAALKKFGVTEERFKKWFNLKECNCTKRKKFLNSLFYWRKKKHDI